ncbi:hypothetical protein [Desulforamulus aquiferis]|uniref:Uncharacterized protein n=1 Tax=Desulforamulus aquiferis TaxID=1397668 RepID=A0AAW7ZAL5_9FIRM|nr:hypothetical protein [Desulforamulus aquiferis]MDO7786530.1 hypothetical protein [Desulforamulus aquiferis]RYD03700.1 hypothetical protein N752_18300 [Desulforamulus aquiferis]
MYFEEFVSEAKGCPIPDPKKDACPQLPGTVLRIFIPAGAVINLLNIIELTSPSGICLIVRLPFLAGKCDTGIFSSLMDSLKAAGAKIELVNE